MLALVANGLVIAFLAATIPFQLNRFGPVLGRLDVLRVLPRWTFFAPNPAMRDSHVVVRDRLRDGTEGPWREVIFAPTRTWFGVAWHPTKRARKIVSDMCHSIKTIRREGGTQASIQYSLPYILLLHQSVVRTPPTMDAIARQFAIVETSGREERRLWITYTSEFHPV